MSRRSAGREGQVMSLALFCAARRTAYSGFLPERGTSGVPCGVIEITSACCYKRIVM